jgi:hypothetical protein
VESCGIVVESLWNRCVSILINADLETLIYKHLLYPAVFTPIPWLLKMLSHFSLIRRYDLDNGLPVAKEKLGPFAEASHLGVTYI